MPVRQRGPWSGLGSQSLGLHVESALPALLGLSSVPRLTLSFPRQSRPVGHLLRSTQRLRSLGGVRRPAPALVVGAVHRVPSLVRHVQYLRFLRLRFFTAAFADRTARPSSPVRARTSFATADHRLRLLFVFACRVCDGASEETHGIRRRWHRSPNASWCRCSPNARRCATSRSGCRSPRSSRTRARCGPTRTRTSCACDRRT